MIEQEKHSFTVIKYMRKYKKETKEDKSKKKRRTSQKKKKKKKKKKKRACMFQTYQSKFTIECV